MYTDLSLYVLRLACKITIVGVLQFTKSKEMHRIEAENRIYFFTCLLLLHCFRIMFFLVFCGYIELSAGVHGPLLAVL